MKQKGFDLNKVATQMLTLMLHGIFFKCDFPLAHFSTRGKSIIFIHQVVDYHTLHFRYFIRISDLHCVACFQNVGIN